MTDESQPSAEQSSYRDSRRAAIRILNPERRHRLRRFLAFVAVTLVVLAVWRWLTGGLPPEQRAVLFIFLLSIGLWATEAVPAFAVGLLIMGYLVFALGTPIFLAEPWDVSAYVNTFSSPVIWLMLGGFFMAEGLSRTGLDRRMLALAMRPAGDQPARVLLAIMLTSAVASMFISNTSTTALMIGAVLPLVRQIGDREPFSKALLVGIPLAAAVGGMGTIIGSAPNAIAVGIAEDFGRSVDFVEWMAFGVPVALALVLTGWWLLMRRYRSSLDSVALDFEKLEEPALPGARDRAVVIVVTMTTIALWITTPLHGIHVAAIALIPIVGLTMTQVMGAANVRGLPWDTLMLVAGGLSLGGAVVDTGLAERLTSGLGFLTETEFTVLVFAGLALITVALSNFMSNTATVSVVLPMAVSLVPGKELELCLILGLSASCALLLPVSTPPNAVAFSTGKVETRDFRPGGILIGLLGPALIIAWVLLAGKIAG